MNIKATISSDLDWKSFDIDDIVERELQESASIIEKEAKYNAPVDTGRLRASIKADVKGLEANIGTDVEYAHFVHDGTYKMPARPFLESAAEAELEDIDDNIADAIVRKLWLKLMIYIKKYSAE